MVIVDPLMNLDAPVILRSFSFVLLGGHSKFSMQATIRKNLILLLHLVEVSVLVGERAGSDPRGGISFLVFPHHFTSSNTGYSMGVLLGLWE